MLERVVRDVECVQALQTPDLRRNVLCGVRICQRLIFYLKCKIDLNNFQKEIRLDSSSSEWQYLSGCERCRGVEGRIAE